MAIDIYSIKAGCIALQNAAEENYEDIKSNVQKAKEYSDAENIQINGDKMDAPFDEIIEQINQVENATINAATDFYNYAYEIYKMQTEEVEE